MNCRHRFAVPVVIHESTLDSPVVDRRWWCRECMTWLPGHSDQNTTQVAAQPPVSEPAAGGETKGD
jgi:hypothetical protein